MTSENNADAAVECSHIESPRKTLDTLQYVGNLALGIGLVGSMGVLSYTALDATRTSVEVNIAYPEIDLQLRAWEFNDVSQLIVNVRKNQFSFTALLVKVPEDSDVVGKLLPTNCTGTYSYEDTTVTVDEAIVCEDTGTIPLTLGGYENI